MTSKFKREWGFLLFLALIVVVFGLCSVFMFTGIHGNLQGYVDEWSTRDGQYYMTIEYTDEPNMYKVKLFKEDNLIIDYSTTFTSNANANFTHNGKEGKINLRVDDGYAYIVIKFSDGLKINLYRA